MTVRFEGVTLRLGGEDFTVPALSLRQVRELNGDIVAMQSALMDNTIPPTMVVLVVKIVHAALSRNYPDLTTDRVEELLDLATTKRAIEAVFGVSGLEQSAGKAEAAPSTGA